MGAKDEQTLKAFVEAESYDGPALIIAYSHCIAHGINMTTAQCKIRSGREHPASGCCIATIPSGTRPEKIRCSSIPPRRAKVADYFKLENRFKMLEKSEPARAKDIARPGAGRRERAPRVLRISRHAENSTPRSNL